MSDISAAFSVIASKKNKPAKLAMQRLWVTGQVLSVGARVSVEHVFRSAEKKPLEVIYAFPLPRDAALRRFRIAGADFEIESDLKDTQVAAALYEDAITQGSLAAMTRQYADGVINLNVGNIRPGETVTVHLEIVSGVELRDDGFRFRFPFTLAPGYHPRARMADGEIELPSDEFGDVMLPPVQEDASSLHEVGFELNVFTAADIAEIGSPSHAVRARQNDAKHWRVALASQADVPDRDLVLDATYRQTAPQVLAGNGRYAAVVPSTEFGANPIAPRRVAILLDRSGSMSGSPLDQAVRAIKACLGVLTEDDRFGVIAFDDQVESFGHALVPATRQNRDAAAKFLESINARGGTELAQGFIAASRMLQGAGGDVVILTDGQVSGTERILADARATNTRLHCLGIGSASQDRFLSLLARETGGVSRFVTPRERVDLSAVDLFASIGRPVVSGLKANGNIQPEPPEFVFAGTPVVLFGEGSDPIELTWEGGRLVLPLPEAAGDATDTLKLLQGARLITDWDSRYPAGEAFGAAEKRKQSRIAARLRELSQQYGLASREMSLVAVVKRAGDRPGELPETRLVPVGMPQDTRFDAYFSAPHPTVMAARFTACLASEPAFGVCFEMAAPPPPPGQTLLDIAASLESDGGMPGKDLDTRVCATIAALFAFVSEGHTPHSGAFRTHVSRLIGYLRSVRGVHEDSIAAALDLVDRNVVPPGDWLRTAGKRRIGWKDIEPALA